jgi:hypothetical protein
LSEIQKSFSLHFYFVTEFFPRDLQFLSFEEFDRNLLRYRLGMRKCPVIMNLLYKLSLPGLIIFQPILDKHIDFFCNFPRCLSIRFIFFFLVSLSDKYFKKLLTQQKKIQKKIRQSTKIYFSSRFNSQGKDFFFFFFVTKKMEN